jgi:predicted enzyme related to lactoylglutathione lyase
VEVLAARTLLVPSDFEASVAFYDDLVGLARFREFGAAGRVTGVVWFVGGGYLEASAHGVPSTGDGASAVRLWWQVRDLDAEHDRLAAAGASVLAPPADMPWGLRECWIADPDGVRICLVEVPDDHPMRRRL